jgi:hypothetical protein
MIVKAITATALCLFTVSLTQHPPCLAQVREPSRVAQSRVATQTETDEDERGVIRAKEFIRSRPGASNPHRGRYLSRQRLPAGRSYANLGVTIGRGRAATEAEIQDHKIAKVRSADGVEYVLERISDDVSVTDGMRMQMIIEYLAHHDAAGRTLSNSIGYLYVINREQYPGGKFGPPSLIFPTRQTYGGDSRVLPGKTVTLPVPDRLWQVSRSKSGTAQAFETYIIIISPRPLRDASGLELQGNNLGTRPLRLEERLVSGWMRLWGGPEWRGDLESGTGQLITQREQSASGNLNMHERTTEEESSDLTQSDVPPQIVFRKVVRPGGMLMVTIKLPYRDARTSPAPVP